MITTINEFKQYLNENTTNIDIAKLVQDQMDKYDDSEFYISTYVHEELHGETDLDEDEIVESDEYKKWLKYDIENRIDTLRYLFDEQEHTLYRKMSVSNEWFDNLKENDKMGVYWSYVRDAAETHWGYQNNEKPNLVELITTVNSTQIDWLETYESNLIPFTGEEEKEIRLLDNINIVIDKIIINDEEQDLSKFSTKRFRA